MNLRTLTLLVPALTLLAGCPGDDTSSTDTTLNDTTGGNDDGVVTTVPVTTSPTSGTPDTGDTSAPDTGTPDTGTPDTGTPDTGDTGMTDTGTPTSGTDTGTAGTAGSETGVPVMDGFGDCANNDEAEVCNADEVCLFGPEGVAFCSQTACVTAADCPAIGSGDAIVTCDPLTGGDDVCWINCENGETCPDGMVCGAGACAWPLMAPGGGMCPDQDLGNTTPQTLVSDNTGLFDDHIPSCGNGGGEDALYQFTAPNDGAYTFDTFGSTFDTTLYLLDGCDGPELACSDDAGKTPQSEVVVVLDAGDVVIVGVDSYGGDVGAFTLNITEAPVPADGNCCIPGPGQMGCEVMAVETCVCALDAFCCDDTWDATCAESAAVDCMASC